MFFDEMATPATRPSKRKALAGLGVAVLAGSLLVSAAATVPAVLVGQQVNQTYDWWESIEVDAAVFDVALPGHVYVTDRDGNDIATFYAENRIPLERLDQISPALIDAVLSVEDREFYEHGPIDLTGTARALARNLATNSLQGGSSISQQYAKLLRAAAGQSEQERSAATETSLRRKVVELKYAIALEERFTKDEILLGYLNAAYFGDGAYGVGAAAHHYFGIEASELNHAQAALLAGILRNPGSYNPVDHPDRALARRSVALNAMVANGKLEQAVADTLREQPLELSVTDLPNGCTDSPHPYYCDWVRATLLEDEAFGATADERRANLDRGGFTVTAALDSSTTATAQRTLDEALGRQDVAAATAVVEPGTGHVLAIAATRDYADTQFNIPVQGQLQVGSTFKPITVAAALEEGFSPATTMTSPHLYVPSSGNYPAGGFRNSDGRSRGPIAATEALKFSVNAWFVKLTERTGVTDVADMAFRLGMTSMDPARRTVSEADLSITLGAFETTVLDVANVYATLAASGVACSPVAIIAVSAADGTALPAPDPACHQALSPAVADTVTALLGSTDEPGGTAQDVTVPGQHWVGKTGTSNDFGATWFAGYTREVSSAVWVGDPRGPSYPTNNVTAWGERHHRVYGATIAAPLWGNLVTALTAGQPATAFPTPGPLTVSGFAMPNLVGTDLAHARGVLTTAGLGEPVVQHVSSQSLPPGTVAAQEPLAGSHAASAIVLQVVTDQDSADE
ncbi:penicillin-binding protein [Pseudactinotalea terrae]|uniref:penicillin-binding protein n=1 Tax=Pseudactinotalea terrae TaxID=1743262 RepID=UPI001391A38A|nr:penicillin-binding protein [Pseudactinotalea terrae]